MTRKYQARTLHGPLSDMLWQDEESALWEIIGDMEFTKGELEWMTDQDKLDAASRSCGHAIDELLFDNDGWLVEVRHDSHRRNDTPANELSAARLRQYKAPEEQIQEAMKRESEVD